MLPNERGRRSSADLHRTAAGHLTASVEPAATLGDVLLHVETDLRTAARRLEHLAVEHPGLDRTARITYFAAYRVRGDRLDVAA